MDLLRENIELRARCEELEEKLATIRRVVVKMSDTLGFTGAETGSEVGKKIISQVPRLMLLHTTQPDAFKEKFSFVEELAPILKDLIQDKE